jgi:invasion protein IalB
LVEVTMTKHILMGAVAGLMLACGVAQAQDAAAAKPELNRVDDWLVRCFPVASPSPCDMLQELDDQRTRQRVVALSIAFYPSLNRHALQITVPLEISIPKGLKIQTDTYTSPVLKYRRCDRNGCYVELAVDNGMIEALAGSSGAAKVIIAADNGKTYPLAFSLKGFSAAHDDMVAKAKAKAKPVSQPDAAAPAPAATP